MNKKSGNKKIGSEDFGTYALHGLNKVFLNWAQSMPATWIGRRMALILRKAVLIQGMDLIDAEIEGIRMRVHVNDNVSERKFLFLPQFFDASERRLIRAHLPPNGVFIDIGANAGIYTLTAAKTLGAGGRVITIEPNPVLCERLTRNVMLNGLSSKVTLVQKAVSDCEGVFNLTLDATNLGGSSLVLARSEDQKITVTCKPLIDILRSRHVRHIDILKIDIEGAEDKALIPFLKDADETLLPRYIIIENSTNDWQSDLLGAFEKRGYVLLETTRMNLIFSLPKADA